MQGTPYELPQVMHYITMQLDASGPSSITTIVRWLIKQCPGISRHNAYAALEAALPLLEKKGRIYWDDGDHISSTAALGAPVKSQEKDQTLHELLTHPRVKLDWEEQAGQIGVIKHITVIHPDLSEKIYLILDRFGKGWSVFRQTAENPLTGLLE